MLNPLSVKPRRIVSLVPSLTELLFSLGLEEEVVGITKFCVHPKIGWKTKTRIGGTKTVDVQKVLELQPDLVIANKEENVREQVEALQAVVPTYVSDVNTLAEALDAITTIGSLTGKIDLSRQMAEQIERGFANLAPVTPAIPTAYFIWQKPYMVAAKHTFINDMLLRCGFENIYTLSRYPEVELTGSLSPAALGCRLLLLSSEPYPFATKHLPEFRAHVPGCKVLLVDGEMFSWYGSRLLKSANYFKQLIHDVTEGLM